ncbi:hypothetical protein CEP54_004079 [Fusarium duplospermum]|uniref:Uncharacterized protein n=1 Tax=Fusarium duplospermum TaxID=1325734 RepID=A0A428QKH0_9HYPO|nr:hypothetical protein CEP54_004079 [Fusarium duplospermum]
MNTEMSQSTVGAPVHTQSHDDDYWTADPARFDIDLDDEESIKEYMAKAENQYLWHRTCFRMITAKKNDTNLLNVQHSFVDDEEAMKLDPSM